MGKFALIAKGPRARKPISVPLRSEPEPVEIRCLVRPLTGAEEATVMASAIEFAKARGLESAEPGDALYEFGLWAHTIALACCDVDAPDQPYFDNVEQALDHLDRDRIALLFELQQSFQDECSPRLRELSPEAFKQSVLEIALQGDDAETPFEKWHPALRASWVRTTARLLVNSPEHRSFFGSAFEKSTKSATA